MLKLNTCSGCKHYNATDMLLGRKCSKSKLNKTKTKCGGYESVDDRNAKG